MQCINLLWVKVALLEFFFGTVDSLIFNSVKDQTARYCRWLEIYLREQIVTRSCIGGLFNFNISKLKTYQFTIVLITTGWTWELVLGNMSSIKGTGYNWGTIKWKKKLRVQSIWFANWKLTDWQTDWPANWQTKDLLTDCPIDWWTYWERDWLTDWLYEWKADWLTG